jgi:PAS domain-containing protein
MGVGIQYYQSKRLLPRSSLIVIDFASPNQAVDTLRGALNEIEIGIVLLDKDLRPQFVNRAFMQMWHLTDVAAVAKLDFEGLMRLVVSKQSRPMPAAKFNEFIKKRTMLIRAGVEDPRDVRIDSGRVIRVTCKSLPDGGRMLVYADVTDLVEQAEKAQGACYGRRNDRSVQSPAFLLTG